MDAKSPIGRGSGMTPKELVAAGLCGCTAMDVMMFLRKEKITVQGFDVSADIDISKGQSPAVFSAIRLTYTVTADPASLKAETLLKAIHWSQTEECGVSAMLAKGAPITYTVVLNGSVVGNGKSEFPE
jgi:putative redox protein